MILALLCLLPPSLILAAELWQQARRLAALDRIRV